MFLRFVVTDLDSWSGKRQGLFQAATKLINVNVLTEEDQNKLRSILDWFNENLEKPSQLALSNRPRKKEQALSWFKPTASKHIAKMRDFKIILESYGVHVHVVKAKRLGYVLYEDEFQVAAYPFSDTPT